jgi:hypothetical protein
VLAFRAVWAARERLRFAEKGFEESETRQQRGVTVKLNTENRHSNIFGMRAVKAALVAGLLAASCAGAARAADDTLFHKTVPLAAGGSFLLDNVNGSVRVEGWDREEVEVSAVKVAKDDGSDTSQVKIDLESHPGAVEVRTLYPKGQGAEVAVEYRIHVPFHVLLGGVSTVNGSVIVKGVDGSGELKTVNGNVEVFDSTGRFSEKTTNGNLRLELKQVVSGGPMKLETVNGSVILGLPQDARANVNALSMNGELYSEFPAAPKAKAAPASHSFNGKLGMGAGGGDISVRTINGGIRLVVQHPAV